MTGRIVDIQRSSLHDGPGLRTTVFFKGCPLHCAWCHNPESISFDKQTLFYAEKCIHCGQCAKGCFSGARVECGKDMTVEDVMKVIRLDKPYFGETGGVTFSGGEPMAQKEFLSAMIDACHAEGVHTAIETSLQIFDVQVLGKLDLILADMKIWDDSTHRQYTGVGNERIKENWRRVNKLGIPLIMHTPVIPEVPQGIPEISAFARTLANVRQYELLPYHPLGNAKLAAMGLEAPAFTVPTNELMKELKQYAFIR